jgi:2-dehydro-3-deoxyphosphooctonate aldolase (KDO 8-P synthase)
LNKGIEIFKEIKEKFALPIITDVHEVCQVKKIADVVDAIQIPAFLCRQTDLLKAAGETGLPVMIKKGQFMRGEDMKHAADKTGKNVILCERGNMMGYSDLVVDYRNLITMRQYAPVIFDATHCVQKMSAKGHSSDGDRQYSLPLTKAALAVGIDGIFAEVHRFPSMAISDRETQIPISGLRTFVRKALDIDEDSP